MLGTVKDSARPCIIFYGLLTLSLRQFKMLEYLLIREAFESRGKRQEVEEYEVAHSELLARIETVCKAPPQGSWGDTRRIREYSLILRQVLLHRAINLFEGALSALVLDNVYTMTLAIRGHFETTGAMGYLHKRLESLSSGHLDPEIIDRDICTQLLGRRDRVGQDVPEAKQVLTLLEHVDKSVSKNILGGTSKQFDILTDCYAFLCEFSHPNFHSNSVAFDIDKQKRQFIIRHSEPMRDCEFNLAGYLLISSPIFVDLFDKIGDILP